MVGVLCGIPRPASTPIAFLQQVVTEKLVIEQVEAFHERRHHAFEDDLRVDFRLDRFVEDALSRYSDGLTGYPSSHQRHEVRSVFPRDVVVPVDGERILDRMRGVVGVVLLTEGDIGRFAELVTKDIVGPFVIADFALRALTGKRDERDRRSHLLDRVRLLSHW